MSHTITLPRILIIGRLSQYSGNHSTATRIKGYFEDLGWHCKLRSTDTIDNVQDFHRLVKHQGITYVIGIHAVRAGKFLKDCPVPYSLVFGGTDLNEHSKKGTHLATMTTAASKARQYELADTVAMETAVRDAVHLITFCPPMTRTAKNIWPLLVHKLREIPQGVMTQPSTSSCHQVMTQFHLEKKKTKLFTLIAGIRPVKDPLYLVAVFSQWHQTVRPDAILLIIGPEVDSVYSRDFNEAIDGSAGVIYAGSMSPNDTHLVIQHSFSVVNTSLSEGMCMALLEAMHLGTPVMARNIPANTALIDHGETGLLFYSPQDFIVNAEELLGNPSLRQTLSRNARQRVIERHNCQHEAASYQQIIKDLQEVKQDSRKSSLQINVSQTTGCSNGELSPQAVIGQAIELKQETILSEHGYEHPQESRSYRHKELTSNGEDDLLSVEIKR